MVGLFLSFLHPRESSSWASKGWPTAEVGGTPPRGFQRLGVPLEGRTGMEDSLSLRAGRSLAGLVTPLPPSGSKGSDWGSLALVAASGSGTPLLPLERLQVALATGTLCLRSAYLRFPFPWQLQGRAPEELGAGQVLQQWEELRPGFPGPAWPRPPGSAWNLGHGPLTDRVGAEVAHSGKRRSRHSIRGRYPLYVSLSRPARRLSFLLFSLHP